MKALTHLERNDGDYAAAVNHFAETLTDPPHRGQVVEWQGEAYRLNRRAVSDIIHVGGARNSYGGGYEDEPLDFEERTADLAAMSGCAEAHPAQGMLNGLTGGRYAPIPCPHCGETPVFTGFAQNVDPSLPGYAP